MSRLTIGITLLGAFGVSGSWSKRFVDVHWVPLEQPISKRVLEELSVVLDKTISMKIPSTARQLKEDSRNVH